jgi:hypothetical protein
MSHGSCNHHPLGPLLLLCLIFALGLLSALFLFDAIEYAYRRIGIGEGAIFAVALASLLGGTVNVPITRLRGEATLSEADILVFGVRYRLPLVRRSTSTILAVNVGCGDPDPESRCCCWSGMTSGGRPASPSSWSWCWCTRSPDRCQDSGSPSLR